MLNSHPQIPIGSALTSLIAGINSDFSDTGKDVPHAICARLQSALKTQDLYLDCAQLLLDQIVSDPSARFLFKDLLSQYTLQLFCWPPGFGNHPHLHDSWTVAAVLTSSLLVFRSSISVADCLASTPLVATFGNAGILRPPQYHCLRNVSDQTSISFHVFPIGKSQHAESFSRSPSSASRINASGVLALAKEAAKYPSARSVGIVRSAFAIAGNSTKLELVKIMAQLDRRSAVQMGTILAQSVGGEGRTSTVMHHRTARLSRKP